MTIEVVRAALGWCTLLNWAILATWLATFVLAHDWLEGVHDRWFRLSTERFDAIHYELMGRFKVAILLFNLTPYLALRLVGS